jgi:hypothetical protein
MMERAIILVQQKEIERLRSQLDNSMPLSIKFRSFNCNQLCVYVNGVEDASGCICNDCIVLKYSEGNIYEQSEEIKEIMRLLGLKEGSMVKLIYNDRLPVEIDVSYRVWIKNMYISMRMSDKIALEMFRQLVVRVPNIRREPM